MAKSYYSTVFDQPVDEMWRVVRDFGSYRIWVPDAEAVIEDGKSGDAVGAVRAVRMGELTVRQQLVAHSDVERTLSYTVLEPLRFPTVRDFLATIRLTPVVDGDRTFLEWWVVFDCPEQEHPYWTTQFATLFAVWLDSLRLVVTPATA